jgi:hypothetical protein
MEPRKFQVRNNSGCSGYVEHFWLAYVEVVALGYNMFPLMP